MSSIPALHDRPRMLVRAAFAIGLALFLVVPLQAAGFDPAPLQKAAKAIETRLQTRIGIAVFAPSATLNWNYNGSDRFPMNSTMKAFACAALLRRADTNRSDLNQGVEITKDMIVPYSPTTEKHIGSSRLTLADLCEAAVTTSDNTAVNLVLEEIGGPAGLTSYMRSIGDNDSPPDRTEPALNEGAPGDPRDTTTPLAAARSLHKLVLSDALSPSSRRQLTTWLEGNKVGDAALRAGLPDNWRIGDKTGAGGYGSRGNIAIIWPPGHIPVAVAVYLTENTADLRARNTAIAEIGAALVDSLGK